MPRVYLSENERLCERLVAWVYGEMGCQDKTQREMAEELEISQPAFAKKLKKRSFSFTDFATMVRVFNPDQKDLDRLLGR